MNIVSIIISLVLATMTLSAIYCSHLSLQLAAVPASAKDLRYAKGYPLSGACPAKPYKSNSDCSKYSCEGIKLLASSGVRTNWHAPEGGMMHLCRPSMRSCPDVVHRMKDEENFLGILLLTILINVRRLSTEVYAYGSLQESGYYSRKLAYAMRRFCTRRWDWFAMLGLLTINARFDHMHRMARAQLFLEICVKFESVLLVSLFCISSSVTPTLATFPSSTYTKNKVRLSRTGGALKIFPASFVAPFQIHHSPPLSQEAVMCFQTHCLLSEFALNQAQGDHQVASNIPLSTMATVLNKASLRSICKVHNIKYDTRVKARDLRVRIIDHSCEHSGCRPAVSVFKVVPASLKEQLTDQSIKSGALLQKEARRKAEKEQIIESTDPTKTVFPPVPPSKSLRHAVVSGMCNDVDPELFQETGCAVCAQLVPLTDLTPMNQLPLDWNLLCRPDATRKVRSSAEQEIEHLDGPVLAPGCDKVCVDCEEKLRKGAAPTACLAHYLWIGEVPPELSDLSFAEQMLIAKVRHNRCVVRVASGRGKMSANAIMFSTPIKKVYDILPTSLDELSEVLAFVFVGSARPTEDDLSRTPMLVRRRNVQAALEWLKLNHGDYEHLTISEDNVNALPEAGIPCGVEWKEVTAEQTNNLQTAISVHDNGEEQGVGAGACSFAVSGLSGEEYSTANMQTLVLKALNHLKSKGCVVAVGQAEQPESLYKNPQLYPSMFPWLFPFGKGGIGHAHHRHRISEAAHKRWLLMYYDKRFQEDYYFPMIAFNELQIKAGTNAGYLLAKTKHFSVVCDRVMAANREIVNNMAARSKKGEYAKPETEGEQVVQELCRDLDHVGGHVQGSMAAKKWMRNELWSLMAFKGAPTWFVTFSPVDNHHPLCLYWADKEMMFTPKLRSADERLRLISKNPAAAARFFHHMTSSFVKHVLGIGSDHSGLYGETDAYYGTVEQQGRLTLHMHMLIWIRNAMSPQVIRDQLMEENGRFQTDLIAYLESCQVGEFLTGTMEEVKARVSKKEAWTPCETQTAIKPNNLETFEYQDPTQTLPEAPPPLCENCNNKMCSQCEKLDEYWARQAFTTDDILLRSNIHTCRKSLAGTDIGQALKIGGKIQTEVRGCLNAEGSCSARFPRELFPESVVDNSDGSIHLRKREPMMNNITPDVTFTMRGNTDTTCLLSGTAVKAVLAYVTDYITKSAVKMYHVFDSISSVLGRQNGEYIGGNDNIKSTVRRMVTQMVNTLTAKVQIGSPMACLYLLGNPDHYTNMKFKPFWWRSYLNEVQRAWKDNDGQEDESGQSSDQMLAGSVGEEDIGHDETDKVMLMSTLRGEIVGVTVVQDYTCRPPAFENTNLFDYLQMTTRKRRTKKELMEFRSSLHERDARAGMELNCADNRQKEYVELEGSDGNNGVPSVGHVHNMDDPVSCHPFSPDHPLYESHYVHCDTRKQSYVVLNILGGMLPRRDQGDRELYCLSMLMLFKPWRSGRELKQDSDNWDETFREHKFTDKALQLMGNFNVRYECNDARDDFAAQDRKTPGTTYCFENNEDEAGLVECVYAYGEDHYLNNDTVELLPGKKYVTAWNDMQKIESTVRAAGWLDRRRIDCSIPDAVKPELDLSGKQWKQRVVQERTRLFEAKYGGAPAQVGERLASRTVKGIGNDVAIVDSIYLTRHFTAKSKQDQEIIDRVCELFMLNDDQNRAFRIVANHAVEERAAPLRMYLGGVGGTGKSQVIKALISFFEERKEPYRFIVLAPTGTAAALLNGSTYHSVLGIRKAGEGDINEGGNIRNVQQRLRGVDYIFLDEVSMVSCANMYEISAKLAKALNEHSEPFGGMSMVFAGDFAQLPPVGGQALYAPDREVPVARGNNREIARQKNIIGKVLWLQVTTVVILKQIMRQRVRSPDDERLRLTLSNLRYGACTPEDILYLQTRTISRRPGHPTFAMPGLRNASIITALNSQKDRINDLGSDRFAEEHGLQLEVFYSNDHIQVRSEAERRPDSARKKRTVQVLHKIPEGIQKQLWDARPSSNRDHLPGKLRLCLGLPVIIRNNEATELCITKGQEAIVVGWITATGNSGQQILETLFVKLLSPPREIVVPGLPPNVVPLTRVCKEVWCELVDDRVIAVSREQIPVLPNFSMTDYSSQGKSRDINVIDLNNCRTHFSYYTALSRSTCSEGTVLLQGLDAGKVTKGISGYLRQEFRELETLNVITRLIYEGDIPLNLLRGDDRRNVLRKFQKMKGGKYEPPGLHSSLKWRQGDKPLVPVEEQMALWELVDKKAKSKRKEISMDGDERANTTGRKRKTSSAPVDSESLPLVPQGPKWDSVHYSCAYDSVVSVLLDIWLNSPREWTEHFRAVSRFLPNLAEGFRDFSQGIMHLESVRDNLRQELYKVFPDDFQYGHFLTDIDTLACKLFGEVSWGMRRTSCERCEAVSGEREAFPGAQTVIIDSSPVRSNWYTRTVSRWLREGMLKSSSGRCHCGGKLRTVRTVLEAPPCIYFSITDSVDMIEPTLAITCRTGIVQYKLRGVIYVGGNHFTARIVRPDGQVWYHDGISTGSRSVYEGIIATLPEDFLRFCIRPDSERKGCGVIYVRCEQATTEVNPT